MATIYNDAASTAARQDTGDTSLASIDSKLTNPLPVSGPVTDAQLRASPIPVLASIDTTGLATATGQTTGNTSLGSIDTKVTPDEILSYGPTVGALNLVLFELDMAGWMGAHVSFLSETNTGTGALQSILELQYRNSSADAWSTDDRGFNYDSGFYFNQIYLDAGGSHTAAIYNTLILVPKARFIRAIITLYDDGGGVDTSKYTANIVRNRARVYVGQYIGQQLIDASIPVVLASDQPAISIKQVNGYTTDIFAGTGTGTANDATAAPLSNFSLQVVKNGAVSAWTIILEGSIDGVNYSTILTHTEATGDGVILWATGHGSRYYRTRCTAKTGGTDVTAHVLATG